MLLRDYVYGRTFEEAGDRSRLRHAASVKDRKDLACSLEAWVSIALAPTDPMCHSTGWHWLALDSITLLLTPSLRNFPIHRTSRWSSYSLRSSPTPHSLFIPKEHYVLCILVSLHGHPGYSRRSQVARFLNAYLSLVVDLRSEILFLTHSLCTSL